MVQIYDFQRFLNRIGNLSLEEMIKETERVGDALQSRLYPGRGRRGLGKEHEFEARMYMERLGRFLFFLRTGIKPAGISDGEFQSFHPVIEKLVNKGQLKPAILDLFE